MAQAKGTKAAPRKKGAASAVDKDNRVIDLDQARAARAEVRGDIEAPRLRLNGEDWELPVEVPYKFAEETYVGNIAGGLAILLGEGSEDILSEMSMEDVEALSDGIAEIYGIDQGK